MVSGSGPAGDRCGIDSAPEGTPIEAPQGHLRFLEIQLSGELENTRVHQNVGPTPRGAPDVDRFPNGAGVERIVSVEIQCESDLVCRVDDFAEP